MLVIFDCDGVLVDSEPLANRVLARHLTALGLETTTEESMAFYMGFSMASNMQKIEAQLGRPLPGDFLENLQADTFTLFQQELKAVGGVEDVITGLEEQGRSFCVASSGDFEKMSLTLGHTGLSRYFDRQGERQNIFSACEVTNGKPAPDLFLHAASQMQAKAGVVVVEDSLPGIQAAEAAGMTALAYLPVHYPQQLRQRLQAVLESSGVSWFEDMRELPALLQQVYDQS